MKDLYTSEQIPGSVLTMGIALADQCFEDRVMRRYPEVKDRSFIGFQGGGDSLGLVIFDQGQFVRDKLDISGVHIMEYGIHGIIITGINELRKKVNITLGNFGRDCPIISVGSGDGDELGLVHVSRKGLEGGILQETFSAFSSVSDSQCHVGPMIGDDEYKVDYETARKTINCVYDGQSSDFKQQRLGEYYRGGCLYFKSLIRNVILGNGIREENLTMHHETTGGLNEWGSMRYGNHDRNFTFLDLDFTGKVY